MSNLLDKWFTEIDRETEQYNHSLWLGNENGSYPAWKKRVLMTKLAADAWQSMCQPIDRGGFDFV
jgi:hypothetical protein